MENGIHGEYPDHKSAYFPVKSYLLNPADCFVWFSPEWNLEFQSTFQEPYEVNNYLGRSFFDLLSGTSLQLIYHSLFQRIRKPGSQLMSLTMRCDKYPFKILMSQELHEEGNGNIKVKLSYLSLELLKHDGEVVSSPCPQPLKMCSWCQSIYDDAQAVWLPLEKALAYIPLLHDHELPAITHGCCPACFQSLRGKLNEYSCG